MDKTDEKTAYLLALECVEELSNKKKRAVLELYESEGLSIDKALAKVLSTAQVREFFGCLDRMESFMDGMRAQGVRWLTCLDEDYPEKLLQIDDPPTALFAKGDVGLLNTDCIAVVGSRKPTRYGAKVAEEFSREFARAGLTIVSGFARGIDSIAHKAALGEHAKTIAVFACGLDVCYPAEHRGMLESMLQGGGLIVSEYALGVKPLQYHFPDRNRIISGLSRAVFLAEAAKKSGSLITVRHALDQGRDIFAVPGSIFTPECEGSNALLREIPHALCLSPEDVLDALGVRRQETEQEVVELGIADNLILEALKGGDLHFEQLLEISGLGVGELTNTLFNLELNGLVVNTGGNYYALS